MFKPLVQQEVIRLGVIGFEEGNGHPYSWSAIFNGYDPEAMSRCPYPGIPDYLNKVPKEMLRLPNALVTHIWAEDKDEARRTARASLIPHIAERMEDLIGQVDAVLLCTDASEHVKHAGTFLEAGVPVFVDKPMADNEADLATFIRWFKEGKPFMSSSCMRYAKEFMPWHVSTCELGKLRYASITMAKSWERYGIHALEALLPIVGPGFLSIRNTGTAERNIIHVKHSSEAELVIANIADMYGAFGSLQLGGTAGNAAAMFKDTFYAFKTQLASFVQYLRSGERPFPFEETTELIKLVIAGRRSRDEGGREVKLSELSEVSVR
ncbi:MAG: Gfo/Idh/MocA family oxidoreductase [Paenibacillaceae bacterium]|nr:Gfo/Idh/MocA family oxidoreductase [Paenibacillaceae bacterium]